MEEIAASFSVNGSKHIAKVYGRIRYPFMDMLVILLLCYENWCHNYETAFRMWSQYGRMYQNHWACGMAKFWVKVKVKLSLCLTKHHAMKTYWGSGGITPRILDLGTRWR
jgi:hypothetical protein